MTMPICFTNPIMNGDSNKLKDPNESLIPIPVYFAKTKPNAIIPTREPNCLGYDFYACLDMKIGGQSVPESINDDAYNLIQSIVQKYEKSEFDNYFSYEANMKEMEDFLSCVYEEIFIPENETVLVPTGIISALPSNYGFVLEERGSTGSRGIAKRAGVIEGDYRGEIFIPLTNHTGKPLFITQAVDKITDDGENILYPASKAIAQGIVTEIIPTSSMEITLEEIKDMKTERGDGKMGSTGK